MNKVFISALVAAMLFGACGKKEQQNNSSSEQNTSTATETPKKEEASSGNKWVGKWEVVKAEGDMADINKGVLYTITETEISTSMSKGKYRISGDTLIVDYEGLQVPFKYLYKWDGDKLIWDVLNSGGQKFYLEKK